MMDIETMEISQKPTPYCIVCSLNNKFLFFYHKENEDIVITFINTIIKESQCDLRIFTHNINFDGFIIINSLISNKIRFEWYIRDLNLYWIKIYYLTFTIEIRCSYKIIPISVSDLGKMLGQSKKIFPHKFSSIANLNYIGSPPSYEFFKSMGDFITFSQIHPMFNFKEVSLDYCKNDVEIVKKVLVNIVEISDKYSKSFFWKSYSFSSLSYRIFSKKYDSFEITKTKIHRILYDYVIKTYYGGRTEVFGNPTNGKIIHFFDFSGMYGQCMMEKFPYGEGVFKHTELNWKNPGFHTIKVESDLKIPVLPVHYKGKLFFPNGSFLGSWYYEEIKLFVEMGGKIIKHYSSYEYYKEDYVFKEFVSEFTKIRSKGPYYKIFGKAIVNGGYGSFALGEDDYITILCFSEKEFQLLNDITDVISYKKYNESYVIKIKKNSLSKKIFDKDSKWSTDYKERNVSYASMIASKARIKLYKALNMVLEDGGDLYYTDTDSVFAGYSTNKIGQSLGEITWSDVYEDGVFVSPKFYCLKEKTPKIKGVSNITLNLEEIKRDFYENKNFIVFSDQLRFKKTEYSLLQEYTQKTLNINFYDKRIFSSDKKTTTAVVINTD